MLPRLEADASALRTYRFELAQQSPAMCMMLRGVLVDESARTRALVDLEALEEKEKQQLADICAPIWDRRILRRGGACVSYNEADQRVERARHKWLRGKEPADQFCVFCGASRLVPDGPNPNSHDQIKLLLYKCLGLPEQTNKKHEVSVDDEVLQRLIRKYPKHWDVLQGIVTCRRTRKQIGLLKSPTDPDGRWRSSFNVGATEVDRWSASKSPMRTGINIQQIAERSRHVFVADPGLWIFYADLEQAESRIVAYDAEDLDYIIAHEGDYDVHTYVARACWPELAWTGDPSSDRALAETKTDFDPHHDYRLYAKKVQHGGNIGMSFKGVARELHIPEKVAKEAVERLNHAFPRRLARQREIIAEITQTGSLSTFLGRRRQFFERLYDSSTHREGLAQTQQSTISWLLGIGIHRVWSQLDNAVNIDKAPKPSDPNRVWLLAQVHDAILGMVRVGDFKTLQEVKRLMTIPLHIRGRTCIVPVEVLYGYNWHKDEMKKLGKETI